MDAAAAGVVQLQAPPSVRAELTSEAATPLLGYLLSLLLQVRWGHSAAATLQCIPVHSHRWMLPPATLLQTVEAEAQRGSSGSKAVRDAALRALRRLLLAVAGMAAPRQGQPAAGLPAATVVSATPLLSEEAAQAADALAFFLPGVAVGLCKALLLAASSVGSSGGGRAPTGPAASSAAAVDALQALTTLLVACLGDAAVEPALHGSAAGGGAGSGAGGSGWQDAYMAEADAVPAAGGADSIQQALQQLQALAQQAKGGTMGRPTAAAAVQPPSQTAPSQRQQQGHMHVERTAEWVQESAERLHQVLSTALPPLLAHQRPAVREALVQGGWHGSNLNERQPVHALATCHAPCPACLAHPQPAGSLSHLTCAGCCCLMDSCSLALQPRTQEALLQLVLSAAQDEWQEVSAPARAWLEAQATAAASRGPADVVAGGAFAAASERLLLQLLEGLPAALRTGDVAGRQHAQQLASAIQVRGVARREACGSSECSLQAYTASPANPPPAPLQVCPPAWFGANVVQHPLRLQQLLSSFLDALSFDASIAGMLLYAAAAPAGAATNYAPGAKAGTAEAATAQQQQQQQQQGARPQAVASSGGQSSGPVVLLPRMPLGLALITTAKTYEAVVAALRAAAALAAAADAAPGSSGTVLRSLVDACLSRLQQLTEAAGGGKGGSAHKRSRQQHAAAPGGGAAAAAQAPQPEAGQPPWQLQAASLAVALAELLLGASPAWQPSWCAGKAAGSSSGTSSNELESLAAAAVQDLVQEAIWSLPTSVAGEGPEAGSGRSAASPLLLEASPRQQRLTAQQLGCNALLLKATIECCGTAARALGPRFAQNGRLLRTALLPLLEKLGE